MCRACVCALIALLVAMIALVAFLVLRGLPGKEYGLKAPPIPLKNKVGDLGGMKVTIPAHIPGGITYNGAKGGYYLHNDAPPNPTHDTKISRLSFALRYPAMAALPSIEMLDGMELEGINASNHLMVNVVAADEYPGADFLDQLSAPVVREWGEYWSTHYEKLGQPEHGLAVYAIQGADPTGRRYRTYLNTEDVYIARDQAGRVDTHITCSTHRTDKYACAQYWSLEQHGVHARVSANYAPDLLAQWRDIQAKATVFILRFKAPESTNANH